MTRLIRLFIVKAGRRLSRLLPSLVVALTLFGAPQSALAASAVNIAQSPLTVRQPVPPNIMLMLDDSGSMDWDYMPDWQYIGHCNGNNRCNPTDDELRDASINGTYYNPDVSYNLPPRMDSTPEDPHLYPASTFPNGYENGFTNRANRKITHYHGSFDYYETLGSKIDCNGWYCTGQPYEPDLGCKSNDYGPDSQGMCQEKIPEYEIVPATRWGRGYYCFRGTMLANGHECRIVKGYKKGNEYPSTPVCPKGGGYNPTTGQCENNEANLFVYTTQEKGQFVKHYVGESQAACSAAPADADCAFDRGTQQNVANWFSYYRTRMLMAKSGLMNAFAGLGENYRVGFASLHNNGKFPKGTEVTSKNGYQLADVKAFGDGSPGSQKSQFWQWIVDAYPSGGTPLRESLQAMGKYYQTSQPWQSKDSAGKTHNLSCRQSYAILTTDGFWNGGRPGVGDVDSRRGNTIKGPNAKSYRYSPQAPFSDEYGGRGDTYSNTLADVAMEYWGKDLQTSLDNEVPTSASDPAFWQHMVTFTIGMGFVPKDAANHEIDTNVVDALLKWSQNPGAANKPASLANWGGWPEPESDNIKNIADLVHAGVNGHGGYYAATDPVSFATGLKSALNRAAERAGTAASLAASSTHLKTGTQIYQALYHTAIWTGDLLAFSVDPTDGTIAKTADWNASDGIPAAADRNIHSYNPSKGSFSKGYVSFDVAGLSANELAALGSDATAQANMVNYLRGSANSGVTSPFTGGWRNRKTLLGDIVNSQPVYVGQVAPNEFAGRSFSGSSAFSSWAASQAARSPRIFVAANDGMLHAFDVATGTETYAYIPAAVIGAGLKKLANPDYGTTSVPHQFFNDGQLTVADVYFDSAWHTVLVGTTGRGEARAVYALDVTDPANISFLWERSAGDGKSGSDYIGQITGKPIIAQVANGDWAVLLGNGYNSSKGVAALLQFNLANGNLSIHTTNDGVPQNGLATPGVWIGDKANNISTLAYAGDNQGNIWSFEISNDDSGTPTATPTSRGVKIYVAKDGDGNRQPITVGMLLGKNPATSDLWAFFGTGRDLAATDRAGTHLQSWYGLIVKPGSSNGAHVTTSSTRRDLAMRKIIYQQANIDNDLGKRVVSPLQDSDANKQAETISGKLGWYLDLAYNGTKENETMVTPNQFQGNLLIGTSRVPISRDPCNPGGVGWTMALDPFTGTNPPDTYFDVNRDGSFDSADKVTIDGKTYVVSGIGFNSIANGPIGIDNALEISLHNGNTETVQTQGGGNSLSTKSWRELVNP